MLAVSQRGSSGSLKPETTLVACCFATSLILSLKLPETDSKFGSRRRNESSDGSMFCVVKSLAIHLCKASCNARSCPDWAVVASIAASFEAVKAWLTAVFAAFALASASSAVVVTGLIKSCKAACSDCPASALFLVWSRSLNLEAVKGCSPFLESVASSCLTLALWFPIILHSSILRSFP